MAGSAGTARGAAARCSRPAEARPVRRAAAMRRRTGRRLLAMDQPTPRGDPPPQAAAPAQPHRLTSPVGSPPPSSTRFCTSCGGHGERVTRNQKPASSPCVSCHPRGALITTTPLNRAEAVRLLICSLLEEKRRIDGAEEYCSFQFATIRLHHGHSGMQIHICSYTLIIVGILTSLWVVAMYVVSFSLNGGKRE